jgi:hypothetical protein
MTSSEVTVIGYCNKTVEELRGLLESGKAYKLLQLKGEFTIVFKTDSTVTIVTSYIGATIMMVRILVMGRLYLK